MFDETIFKLFARLRNTVYAFIITINLLFVTIKIIIGVMTMDYISEIFERANFQDIREFLLHGVGCVETNPKNYKERLKAGYEELKIFVESKYTDNEELEKMMNCILMYVGVIEDVYMEIGLKCGITIMTQLTDK